MYVKVVFSWFGWGQDLLVYYESYLKVHVKMYVTVVYSWFSWGLTSRKQSRNCRVRFSVLHFASFVLKLSIIRGESTDERLRFRFSGSGVRRPFSVNYLSEL